ncbi:redox-sensing transcriptional repressor Rex [Allofustis seminis]|uniref:redox-sensing transcriptional repressor Rex n=1 Tax=Allofustis seminis TaxID=166939 RepID=UPI00037A9BB0|nr:redox-sensing transcriptional repressor Rex [Allofustis seminis]
MTNKKVPRATARRLPIYHRYLTFLHDEGVHRISSAEFSELVKIDSATIRRDFSFFGTLGRRGYGYDVEKLMNFFAKQLRQDRLTRVILIGVGSLGSALLNYNFQGKNNISISEAFDVNEDIIGTKHNGVMIYSVDALEDRLAVGNYEIAILAVPGNQAQKLADRLVKQGIKGIMNFTSNRLNVPHDVLVQTVDLSNELQSLVYFIEFHDDLQ